ncbi:MAG: sugar phosphate isomerase/epimerase [Acidobacteria bacterium]|nr:sugar phosphate isomerase/epimerase [Acidobacteriota bacterium]
MHRRSFLATAAAASSAAAPAGQPVLLGGPTFLKSSDPRELAREARRLGYSAAYCPRAASKDTALLKAIEEGFAAEKVVLSEVGVWVNLMDADAAKRKENLDKVTEGLAVADAVGARCCVDIAGSFHPKIWYGPDPKNFSKEFFDASVENARKVIDAVKPRRAKFAYEMMGWSVPDSPDSYLRLIRAIDRPGFGVHIDVCNGINSPERFYNNGAFIEECFRKLGRWIASCHAKDLEWITEMNVHFVEVVPGRGKMDYRAYLKGVASLAAPVPLMLEHLKTAEEYAEGAGYIRKVAAETGVKLG